MLRSLPWQPRATAARLTSVAVLSLTFAAPAWAQAPETDGQRPMTFLDMQHFRNAGSPAPSPDGQWLLYTVSTPDWEEARSQSDIYLVSLREGVSSTRQLTFTTEKNESSPRGRGTAASSRSCRTETRRATATRTSSTSCAPMAARPGASPTRKRACRTSRSASDGRWLVYRSGRSGEQQLYRLPVEGIETAAAEQITRQTAGVEQWQWAPDSRRIYFIASDSLDEDERLRREKRFTVDIRNTETPPGQSLGGRLDPVRATRLTQNADITVSGLTISEDGRWIGFPRHVRERYRRNITEQNINADLYLLEVATGQVERLTDNDEVGESGPYFSPDGRWVAFVRAR
jgi:Tol biopolymer transport system component